MEGSERVCRNCGKSIAKKGNVFCSRSCSASFNNRGVRRHGMSPVQKPCENCGTLTYNRRFCSRACGLAKFNEGSMKGKNGVNRCLGCGARITSKFFCSQACQTSFRWDKRKENFEKTGEIGATNDSSRRKFLKRYLTEKKGQKCEICGTTEWMGKPVPLVLDHINGNGDDDDLSNLRLVCGNCDMQLPTYKGRNIGKGRQWRRKRYADGKSY